MLVPPSLHGRPLGLAIAYQQVHTRQQVTSTVLAAHVCVSCCCCCRGSVGLGGVKCIAAADRTGCMLLTEAQVLCATSTCCPWPGAHMLAASTTLTRRWLLGSGCSDPRLISSLMSSEGCCSAIITCCRAVQVGSCVASQGAACRSLSLGACLLDVSWAELRVKCQQQQHAASCLWQAGRQPVQNLRRRWYGVRLGSSKVWECRARGVSCFGVCLHGPRLYTWRP